MKKKVTAVDPCLVERLSNFMLRFYLVFDKDWWFTKQSINEEYLLSPNGTFLDPFPGEFFSGGKGDNWHNRSGLLAAWRELVAYCESEGIYSLNDSLKEEQ